MNPIENLFYGISDEELKIAIAEIRKNNKTGIIQEDGIVRKYARELAIITNESHSMFLMLTEVHLLRQAAYRWIK